MYNIIEFWLFFWILRGDGPVQFVYICICAAAAWAIVCLFFHCEKSAVFQGIFPAAVICTGVAYLLSRLSVTIDATPLLLLPLAFLLPLTKEQPPQNRLLAYFLSVGTYCLLSGNCGLASATWKPLAAITISTVMCAALVLAAFFCRGFFPPADWEMFFESKSPERFTVRKVYIWAVLGLMAVCECVFRYLIVPGLQGIASVGAFICSCTLYGCGVYAACLMVAYRRERLATLVEQDYRNEMQAYMSVIRSQRHDYNFHVQALAGLFRKGDMDECRTYLDNLVRDSTEMNTYLPIKDPAIAALVFSFRTMAFEYGIELHMDIQNDLSNVVTSVYETNKVIGNLLQNAIDEVRTHKDKSFGIHLYILKRGEDCIIHVANKVMPKGDTASFLQDIYKPGHSTKDDHEGIGLSSIQNLLSRYRGVVYSRMDDDIIHFVAKIPMSIQGGAK